VKDMDGVRIIGAYNTSDWYVFAYLAAQSKACWKACHSGALVWQHGCQYSTQENACIPVFLLCLLHRIGDRNRSDPGSWLMVACLPHYNEKAAWRAAGRPNDRTHWHQKQTGDMDMLCAALCLVY
jgi:hypothetical protein